MRQSINERSELLRVRHEFVVSFADDTKREARNNMYYLQKSGVYLHGTFWIGENLGQGIIEADEHAEADTDDYHQWQVCEYTYGSEHDIVYETEKGKKAN